MKQVTDCKLKREEGERDQRARQRSGNCDLRAASDQSSRAFLSWANASKGVASAGPDSLPLYEPSRVEAVAALPRLGVGC